MGGNVERHIGDDDRDGAVIEALQPGGNGMTHAACAAHPPQPSASVVEAMKHLRDIINCGNCSWSRQSARLALRALKGDDANG